MELDYLDDDEVSPIIIFISLDESDKIVECNIPMLIWFLLNDLIKGILLKQGKTRKNIKKYFH